MKKSFSIIFALLSLMIANLGYAGATVIVNSANPDSPDTKTLSNLLVGKAKFWPSGGEVSIAVLKSDADANALLKEISGMDGNRFKSHWQRLAFSGRGKMPKLFDDASALTKYISENKGAIGIVPDSTDTGSVKAL